MTKRVTLHLIAVSVLAAIGAVSYYGLKLPHGQPPSPGNITEIEQCAIPVVIGDGTIVSSTNYQSTDFQDLQSRIESARQNIAKYPDNPDFQQALTEALHNLETFKKDELKLAKDISMFPITSERLRQAKQYLKKGNYGAARIILDDEQISKDQDALLDKQQRLTAEQATVIDQHLKNNAKEFLLKARLTALDYTFPYRIRKTKSYFEAALKSERSPENLFDYAYFLQGNNQLKDAERLYQEALEYYRKLAQDKPCVYFINVAMALNNLGILVEADSQRWVEAEDLFKEALEIRSKFAKVNPGVYLPDVAETQNKLGGLVQANSQRRVEAERLFQEALEIDRKLAKTNRSVYLPQIANILSNLGEAHLGWKEPKQALIYLKESKSIFESYATLNPGAYGKDLQDVQDLLEEAKEQAGE